ncbi:transposase [Desulfurobacterium indicum]
MWCSFWGPPQDIQELLSEMYGMEISPSLISKLTERIIPKVEEWQW